MVVLYSTGCPRCKVLKKKLDTSGVEYVENNSVEDMLKIGISSAPVLDTGDARLSFEDAVQWVRERCAN